MSRVRGWKDRHGVGHVLITGSALVLSLTAVTGIVAFDDPRVLRLSVVAALWALICAVTATRLRPEPLAASQELRLQRVYQAELEREIVARREYELWLEVRLRRELEETVRRDVEALRVDVESLHRVVVDDWAHDGSPVASWAQVMPDPEYWDANPALSPLGPAGELPGPAHPALEPGTGADEESDAGFALAGRDTPSESEVPVNGSVVPITSSPTATGAADDSGEQTGVGWPGGGGVDRDTDPGLGWPSTRPRREPADTGCGPTTTGRPAGVAGRYDQGAEVADREREPVPADAGEPGVTVGSDRPSIEALLSGSDRPPAAARSVAGAETGSASPAGATDEQWDRVPAAPVEPVPGQARDRDAVVAPDDPEPGYVQPTPTAGSNGTGTHRAAAAPADSNGSAVPADTDPTPTADPNGTGTDSEAVAGRHHRGDDDYAAPWLVVDADPTADRPRRRHYREDGEENEVLARVLGR